MSRRKVWEHDNEEYRNESLARLRAYFPPGSEVTTVVRHVTQSGMSRVISVLAIRTHNPQSDGDVANWRDRIINVSRDVARVVGWAYDNDHGGVYVTGCGMDMAFHTVYTLASILYRDTADEPARAGYLLDNRTI